MLLINGAVRTLIAWFTLSVSWTAFVVWFGGMPIMRFILSHSLLYGYALAIQVTGMPTGNLPLVIFCAVVACAGVLLASLTLALAGALAATCRIIAKRA